MAAGIEPADPDQELFGRHCRLRVLFDERPDLVDVRQNHLRLLETKFETKDIVLVPILALMLHTT